MDAVWRYGIAQTTRLDVSKASQTHVDDQDVPAAPDGTDGYAEWVQIASTLFRVELEESLRESEDYLNEMPHILAVFSLDEAPHYSSLYRWEQQYRMRQLRRLLRASTEQAGWVGEAAIDASGFQRDQTSFYYRDRASYSLQSLKTTISIDVNSLAIKDLHYTTKKAWDGHIGMQVFHRNAEDLRVLSADANYSWSDLRQDCRSNSTRPLIRHREQTPLQKAHNARMNEDYNQRWMSETGFSQLKEDDGEKLRSRSWHRQFREQTRAPASLLRTYLERHRRPHRNNGPRFHSCDPSAKTVSCGYCIFCVHRPVSDAMRLEKIDPTLTQSCVQQGKIPPSM